MLYRAKGIWVTHFTLNIVFLDPKDSFILIKISTHSTWRTTALKILSRIFPKIKQTLQRSLKVSFKNINKTKSERSDLLFMSSAGQHYPTYHPLRSQSGKFSEVDMSSPQTLHLLYSVSERGEMPSIRNESHIKTQSHFLPHSHPFRTSSLPTTSYIPYFFIFFLSPVFKF